MMRCWRRVRHALFVCAAFVCLALPGEGRAQTDTAFMGEAPPRRLALVVGNSAYVNAARLPGSIVDAVKMQEMLTGLGFTVTPVKDVLTRSDFVENYLRPFIAQIKEGDVVIFYFSGHGFSYGGENYIAPLDFKLSSSSDDILKTFISTTGIEMQMTDRQPGLVLIVLDACRTIPNLKIKTKDKDDSAVSKGFAEPRAPASTVYWFSSALGATSTGSSEPKLSVYTQALADHIAVQGRVLDDILREVRFAVMFRTGHGQVPWTSASSSAQFYFKPTPTNLDMQKTLWRSAYEDGTKFQVMRFVELYGTGPYGASARRWLVENPDAPDMQPSLVSPITAEVAWMANAGRDIVLPRIDGYVMAQATDIASPTASIAASATRRSPASIDGRIGGFLRGGPSARTAEVPLPPPPPPPPPPPMSDAGVRSAGGVAKPGAAQTIREEQAAIAAGRANEPALTSARTLNRLGGGVVVGQTEARALPTSQSPVVRSLPPGAAITIDGIAIDKNDRSWLRARTSRDDATVYIEQQATDAAPIDVGKPVREVSLLLGPEGTKSLVDTAPLVETLKQLGGAGTRVTWVSIATPKGASPGSDALLGLQAVYVKSVLAGQGVARDIVTTSEGASEIGIRVRIFGRGTAP